MSNLGSLYQELILDHSRHPRHAGKLADATHIAEGDNPLCGDRITLFLKVENNVVTDVRFEGEGCAISTASASLMTDNITGKNTNDIKQLFSNFHKIVTDGNNAELPKKLLVFGGVRAYPMRVKCATLAWHTLNAALAGDGKKVSTE